MNPIAETRIPIMLDVGRMMVFNANTMCAYEEATGKFFLDTVASLYEAMKPALDKKSQDSSKGGDAVLNVNPMGIGPRVRQGRYSLLASNSHPSGPHPSHRGHTAHLHGLPQGTCQQQSYAR